MFNLIKAFGVLFFAKTVIFGLFLDAHISYAKTTPFIPFDADIFVHLKHIGIQIIEKK